MKPEHIISIAVATLAIFKWLYEYSKHISWQKNKFLLERLDLFKEKESTRQMHLMLDWNNIKIQINGKEERVNDDIIFDALETHNQKSSFSTLEVELRKIFDEYFDGLNEFYLLSKTKLISKKNFKIYMKYWLDILNGTKNSKSQKFNSQVNKYLIFYGYEDLYHFINE